MIYNYLLVKKLINFELKIENKLFLYIEYYSNFDKLDFKTSRFNKNNYENDKIIESDNLFLNSSKLDYYIIKNSKTNYKNNKVLKDKNFTFNYFEAGYCNLLLLNNCLMKNLDNIIRMIKFDKIYSSLLFKLAAIDISFLISIKNEKYKIIREIYIKILEVEYICQAIIKYFDLKATP